MFVKICGITRLEDAVAAAACGASALGFVFWEGSPRWIDPTAARAITARLPPFVTPVGVFVNQPADYVNDVSEIARLGVVQLHGDEEPDFARQLHRPVLKAMSVAAAADPSVDERWPPPAMVLLDAQDPLKRGGTGTLVDWAGASVVAARRRILLAGGLTPENVAGAVERVRPFGIDVSSGVESRPGVKDHGRIQALFEAMS